MLALMVGSELTSTIALVIGIISSGEVAAWEVLLSSHYLVSDHWIEISGDDF